MLRDQGGPEAWRQDLKLWNNKLSSAKGWWNADSTPTTWWSRSSPTTTSWMPRTLGRPSSSFTRKSSTSKPRSMTCKTKTVSMNIDSRGWVWLQIWGSRRLDHPSMMVSLCLGRWTTSPHHQQPLHLLHQQRRHNHMGMGTHLGNCQAWGGAPVSYHHHTPFFTIFLSSILLVVSWSSRIKFWYDLVLSFALWSLYVIESMSYIINISVESRAWLFCLDLEWIKEKRKRINRSKEIILILWRVMTSHRKSMMIKSCWELTNIALVIVAINRK